jgi:hypothetical protein
VSLPVLIGGSAAAALLLLLAGFGAFTLLAGSGGGTPAPTMPVAPVASRDVTQPVVPGGGPAPAADVDDDTARESDVATKARAAASATRDEGGGPHPVHR